MGRLCGSGCRQLLSRSLPQILASRTTSGWEVFGCFRLPRVSSGPRDHQKPTRDEKPVPRKVSVRPTLRKNMTSEVWAWASVVESAHARGPLIPDKGPSFLVQGSLRQDVVCQGARAGPGGGRQGREEAKRPEASRPRPWSEGSRDVLAVEFGAARGDGREEHGPAQSKGEGR